MMSTLQKSIESSAIFSSEADFLSFAVGFTAYDNVEEPILDKSIGELVFEAYEWGEDANGTYYVRHTNLPTHACTDEELGLV